MGKFEVGAPVLTQNGVGQIESLHSNIAGNRTWYVKHMGTNIITWFDEDNLQLLVPSQDINNTVLTPELRDKLNVHSCSSVIQLIENLEKQVAYHRTSKKKEYLHEGFIKGWNEAINYSPLSVAHEESLKRAEAFAAHNSQESN